jgi:M6 family metalloprotease-like protein
MMMAIFRQYGFGLVCFFAMLAGTASAEEVLTVNGLAISISFSDTNPEYVLPLWELDDFFNDPDYAKNPANVATNSGSLWSYFHQISNGKFSLNHAVAEYAAPRPAEYYLHESVRAIRVKELLDEALLHLRDVQKFDFSKLTQNEEGELAVVAISYVCNAEPRDKNYIPGYAGGMKQDYGAFKTKRFHIVPQRNFFQLPDGRRPLVLRTFAHEAAHAVLDWPDLYDVDGSSRGLGMASLMSGTGDYTNPLLPTAYLRAKAGWIPVVDIADDPPGTVHKVTGDSEIVYRYNHPTNPDEYYLIDAAYKASRPFGRLSTGKNGNLPPEGLRIWHVDESGVNSREAMTPSAHYKMSMVQADGKFDLEKNVNAGDAQDTFYKGNATEFSDATLPNAHWWDGTESGLRIKNISAIGPVMTFATDHHRPQLFVDNARPFKIRQTQGYLNLPANRYRLTNTSPVKRLGWVAKTDAQWLELSEGSGQLDPGESVVLTARVAKDAIESLGEKTGSSLGRITISSMGDRVERQVELTVDPPALVHHWTFDGTKGNVVKDQCRAASADISMGKQFLARQRVAGWLGQGMNAGRRGELVADLAGWTTGTITLSAWVKIPGTAIGRSQMLMHFPNENAGLLIDREGTLRYTWGQGAGGEAKLELVPNKWVFVALSIAPKYAVISAYLPDGELQSTRFPRRNHRDLELTRFYIGGTSSKNNLEGSVDDVRMFNYALNDDELRDLASAPQKNQAALLRIEKA